MATPSTLTEADIRKLKVAELKTELSSRDLPQTGKKDELVQRLLDHMNASKATPAKAASPTKPVAVATDAAATGDKTSSAKASPVAAKSPKKATGETSAAVPNDKTVVEGKTQAKKPLIASHKLSEEEVKEIGAELEKRKQRAERFGTVLSEEDKKLERALRFGELITVNQIINDRKNGKKPQQKQQQQHQQQQSQKNKNKNNNKNNNNGKQSVDHQKKNVPKNASVQQANKISNSILHQVDIETLKRRVEKFGQVNQNVEAIIQAKQQDLLKQQRAERFSSENGEK